jgi:hypothetical protein
MLLMLLGDADQNRNIGVTLPVTKGAIDTGPHDRTQGQLVRAFKEPILLRRYRKWNMYFKNLHQQFHSIYGFGNVKLPTLKDI